MKNGFTLAEVLITLGVIGVVAAMTLPTLIKEYQKTVWVNQLKKTVSTLEQGYKKILADEGVDKLSDTPYNFTDDCRFEKGANGPTGEQWDCTSFVEAHEKYFNGKAGYTKSDYYFDKENQGFDEGGEPVFILNDGTILWTDVTVQLLVDVNGYSKPNKVGRDIFRFFVNEDGHIVPDKWGSSNANACKKNSLNEGDCFARLYKNGWVMDY